MNLPQDFAKKLAKQWHNAHWREQRLLSADAWPLKLNINQPDAKQFALNPTDVRAYIECWRQVRVGDVEWTKKKYRDADEAIELPACWRLHKPKDWADATDDAQIQNDYIFLSHLIAEVDALFRNLLIRRLANIRHLSQAEVVQITQVALQLTPGCAQGKPLRALSIANNDSKFFERHRRLLTAMLDLRFDGAVSEQGLEAFLGAPEEKDHWLLIVPLQAGLLPFQQLRVRASELVDTALPAEKILVVENEQCVYQLPEVIGCIAILGAGLNLNWLQADWLAQRQIAYWGDMDSWGLAMLAKARTYQPHVQALMMDQATFQQHAAKSVVEPVPYQAEIPQGLADEERLFFHELLQQEKGRLEQEFLPAEYVAEAVRQWVEK